MTRKAFPTSKRAAIWRAHEGRCIYCTELVAFADLDIDHIVPSRLKDGPGELAELLAEYGLPADFDLDSMLNLAPAHRRCNLQKNGQVLPKSRALHFLSIAESRYGKACRIEAEIKAQEVKDRLTVLLEIALEEGRVSREELSALVATYAEPQEAFEILTALPFGDSDLRGFFQLTDIDLLYDRPILSRLPELQGLAMVKGGSDEIAPMLGHRSAGGKIVYTCREWAEAVRDGYYAPTTLDLKLESFFKNIYALIAAMAQAKIPKHKFITDQRVSIANFDLLPVALLPGISDDGPEELRRLESKGVVMRDLIARGRVKIRSASPLALTLHYNSLGLHLNEILRADLNDDGIEDILVGAYEWALGGSYGAGYAIALTRLGIDQPFSVAQNINLEP